MVAEGDESWKTHIQVLVLSIPDHSTEKHDVHAKNRMQ